MTAAAGCLLPKNAIRRCLRSPTLIRVRLIQIMEIHGFTDARFAPVRDAFCRNMEERREVGAAYCVYHRGEVVVDLWAGMADANRGLRWQEDTLAVVFSSTKGVTAILANLLIERDLLDPDLPIAHYWPEFAASGKAGIPVDMILTHRAGIPIIDAPLTLEECLAWDPVIEAIASQKPFWEPGEKHGYHVRTYGWILGELIRRVTGVSPGTFLATEVAGPLGADFYIGLPEDHEARVCRMIGPPEPEDPALREAMEKFVGPDTALGRALHGPSQLFHYDEMWNTRALHAAEMPSSNGIATARGLARLYAGTIDERAGQRILQPETLAHATMPRVKGKDAILGVPTIFGRGFMRPPALTMTAGSGAFGHPGAGGSLGLADPETGLAIGYVMNRMAPGLSGDVRAAELVRAAYAALN